MEKAGKATGALWEGRNSVAGGACERLRAGGISVQALWLACKSQQLSQLCCPILSVSSKGCKLEQLGDTDTWAGLQVGTKACTEVTST